VGTGFGKNPMLKQKSIGPKSGNRFWEKSDAQTKDHRTQKWEPVWEKSDAQTKDHRTQKWEPVWEKSDAQTKH
jgi:hypothetical protein